MPKLSRRTDEGSIALTMLIVLVASSLIVTVAVLADTGLRSSRRAGDSANGLQLADAGVNDAVKQLTNYTGALSMTAPAGYNGPLPVMPTITRTLGGGDRYEVIAAKLEPNNPASIWHITARGVDGNGVQRKIEADAVPQPLIGNAIFGKGNLTFGAGLAVDSYSSGLNAAATCNHLGTVGTEQGESGTPPSNGIDVHETAQGNGNRNCTGQTAYLPQPAPNSGVGWVVDGCISYADAEPVPRFKNESTNNRCGFIRKITPKLPIDDVTAHTDPTDWTCDAATAALTPGVHNFRNVTLNNGCKPVPQNYTCFANPFSSSCKSSTTSASPFNPVKLIVTGSLTIGENNGGNVNEPPANCPLTVASGTDYYQGVTQSDLKWYCRQWPGSFQIYASGQLDVTFKKAAFWGVVFAPQRQIVGGSPQSRVFGAILGSSVSGGTQLTVHYDESLSQLTNGRYAVENWREESIL
jgi:hypothetical protein